MTNKTDRERLFFLSKQVLMQGISGNSQSFLSDELSLSTEAFRGQVLNGFANSVVDYTRRCVESKIDNNRESFLEFMKFTPATAEVTRASASKAQTILSPGGGAKGGKVQTDDELLMIERLRKGTWEFNWKPEGCQKFSVTGKQKYTFCGDNTLKDANFCTDCMKLKSIIKIKLENDPFDPQEWFKTKTSALYKKFGIEPKGIATGPTTEKKVVKQGPPGKTTVTEISPPRPYKGKGVPAGSSYYWIHVDQLMGGFVIDAENNLVGVSKVCTMNGNVIDADDAQKRRFETIAKKLPSESSRVNQEAKTSSILRPPSMPKTIKKPEPEPEPEPEEEPELDEIVTNDDDYYVDSN